MRHTAPLTVLALHAVLGAQAPQDAQSTPCSTIAVAEASNAFCWDLYRALDKGDANVVFSPYSVSVALAMARLGADGETAVQMDTALRASGLEIAPGHSALARSLKPRRVADADGQRGSAYELRIANALWGQAGCRFEAPFLRVLRQLGAPLRRVDFRTPARARTTINAWVSGATRRKIRNIVPDGGLEPETRLVLGNAVYFKAAWHEPFDKKLTRSAPFTTAGGNVIQVPMMHAVRKCRYAETNDAQIVEIPYRGAETVMWIVLPKIKSGLGEVEAKISTTVVADWRRQLRSQRVDLVLPRFDFDSSQDLRRILPAMGMVDAFDPDRADFSAMAAGEPLFIAAVLHKASVTVDEAGTVAAAATTVRLAFVSEPVTFRADHPFLFFIEHKRSGCVMFAGRVVSPEQTQ